MAEEADHIFVYGKLRPDAPDNTAPLGNTSGAKKAYLMGSRLYCLNEGGQHKAAVRLEEPGHAVSGFLVKAANSGAMSALLQESESKEYSPQLYERDIVEVRPFCFHFQHLMLDYTTFAVSTPFREVCSCSSLVMRRKFDVIDLCLLFFLQSKEWR